MSERRSTRGAGRARGRGRAPRGFTLLELLAVCAIMAAFGVMVLPRLAGSRARGRVLAQARAALALARTARARATTEGRAYLLVVDADARELALARRRDPLAAASRDRGADPELEPRDEAEGWSRPLPFEADVTLVEAALAAPGVVAPTAVAAAGRHEVAFGPDGDATAARLVFEGKGGDRVVVVVDPILGVARAVDEEAAP